MRIHTFNSELWLPRPVDEIFAFFADAANLQAITPEWLNFKVFTPPPVVMRPGALVATSMGQFYISISAGKLEGYDVFAVSPAAPVAVALKGLRAGEEAAFNGKMVRVLAVE